MTERPDSLQGNSKHALKDKKQFLGMAKVNFFKDKKLTLKDALRFVPDHIVKSTEVEANAQLLMDYFMSACTSSKNEMIRRFVAMVI